MTTAPRILVIAAAVVAGLVGPAGAIAAGGPSSAFPGANLNDVTPSAAVAGATVTLTGTDFLGGGPGSVDTVTIGGVAATSFVVVSDTTLTAVVPPCAAGVAPGVALDVTVSGPSYGSETLSQGFSYGMTIHVPTDQPTLQAAVAAACAGSEIVIGPGTHPVAGSVVDKSLSIRGSSAPRAPSSTRPARRPTS